MNGGCVSYIMNFVPRKFDLENEAKVTPSLSNYCNSKKKKVFYMNQSKPLVNIQGNFASASKELEIFLILTAINWKI